MGLKMERNRNDRNDWEMKSVGFEKKSKITVDGEWRWTGDELF